MSKTDLAQVTDQIQKYWSPVFTKRLRENLLLAGLVNKDYEGAIAAQGDTVRVSQIVDLTGSLTTVGTDADTFATEQLSTTYIDIKADKRAVAAVEFSDLVQLQSQIDQAKVQDPMMFAIAKQMNDYLYSLVAPSNSAPDLTITGVSAMDVANLGVARLNAGTQKWRNDGSWFALLDSTYWTDLLVNATLSNSQFVQDAPLVGGQAERRLMNFRMFEDNSRAAKTSLFAHPDFMHLVQQTSVQVKVSDLHSQKRFGYVMSVDLVFGAKLGIQGNLKHLTITA